MMTQLEMKVCDEGRMCEEALTALRNSLLAKFMAAKEYRLFLDELSYLSSEIDEIANLVVSAKTLIADSEAIRAMLLYKGSCAQPVSAVQFISPESAIARELFKIQESKNEKVFKVGKKLKDYNNRLRALRMERESGFGRRWRMNIAGFPKIANLPYLLDVNLLSELYNDQTAYIIDFKEPTQHFDGGRTIDRKHTQRPK